MHYNALRFPTIHCQCTRFLFLLAKEVQDQRRSWECQTKFWCIVPCFKTLSSLRFRIISEFSWKHWSVGQSCVLPLSYQGFSWWQRLTQWAKKKGVTDVSQAHNQSKPRQWAEIQVGGRGGASYLTFSALGTFKTAMIHYAETKKFLPQRGPSNDVRQLRYVI